ncbi:MAG: hypothetical protein DRQ24_09915 [Candidatus Latescibacterota bacterium]|nr:MAG: hypothetical protein DRQ24_09915 [Candidatus Latescibacterota bacterium]
MRQSTSQLRHLGITKALRENAGYIVLFSLVAGVLVLLNIAKPVVFSKIIDGGLLKKNWSNVQLRCLHFLIIALAISLCSICHGILASVVSNRFATAIKESVVDRTFKLHYDFFHRMTTGDILTRIHNNVESIRDFLMSILHSTMSSFLNFLSVVLYIGFVQWRMLIAGFVIVPFVVLCIYSFRKVTYRRSLRARQARSNCNEQMVSSMGNIIYQKEVGIENRILQKIKEVLRELKAASIYQDIWTGVSDSTMSLLMAIGYVITIGYGGWLAIGGRLSIGNLFAFLTLRKRFISPLDFTGQIYTRYYTTKPALARLREFYSHPIETGNRQHRRSR